MQPGSVWSLLLFCQKATRERTEVKTAHLLHNSVVAYIISAAVDWACVVRDQVRDTDSGYVMKKPSRCWMGAVPRYWKVVASCFQFISFAENASAPLAPRASFSPPILLLYFFCFCFLAHEFVYKTVSQIFLFFLKFSGFQKKTGLAYKRLFSNVPMALMQRWRRSMAGNARGPLEMGIPLFLTCILFKG